MHKSLLLIDGDPIVYRCGFAAQGKDYHYTVEFKTGDPVAYKNLRDRNGRPKRVGDKVTIKSRRGKVIDREDEVLPEPLENALQAVKVQMESIFEHVEMKYGEFDTELYIGGKGNYREKIATLRPYKGNRDPTHKPIHYAAIREHLIEHYGAHVVNGCETDDELSIRMLSCHAYPYRHVVVATIDKDLDQVPGKHYDYMKHVHYDVSQEDAVLSFYTQVLAGDSTDNIPGAYKVGPVTAAGLIDRAWAMSDGDEHQLWKCCVKVYGDVRVLEGYPYGDADPAVLALENARLVKLQEYHGQLWNPPGVPDDMVK